MICVIILLLLVPGMLTWKIADGREFAGLKEFVGACVSWLIYDLMIACVVYALFYVLKGPVSASFSVTYPSEEVYYSIYDISFVFRYSAMALVVATVLGAAARLAGKLLRRKGED